MVALPISLFLYPLVAFLVYRHSLRGQPIFDDNEVLPNAFSSQPVTLRAWMGLSSAYRALTVASFLLHGQWFLKAANDEEFQRRVLPFAHGENILIHSFCGMIVQGIALTQGMSLVSATLTGLLFVVHPFAVNTVSYITGRASLLSAFFGLSGVLAILSGHNWLAVPCWMLACWAKEDGVAFLPLYMVLDQGLISIILLEIALVGVFHYRGWIKEWWKHQGDKQMSSIGLPVALPFWSNFYTILTETLIRIPQWLFGMATSPYHGSGFKPRRAIGPICLAVLAVFCALLGHTPTDLVALLILVGPWLVYLVCPVPDQITEYRCYSMLAGFSLLISILIYRLPMAWPLWLAILPLFAWSSYEHAKAFKTPLDFWKKANETTSADRSRSFQEIGAMLRLQGKLKEAEPHFKRALELNPKLGPAMDNLAWTCLELGRPQEAKEVVSECIKQCPNYALGWLAWGAIADVTSGGRAQESKAAYEKALELDNRLHRGWNRLGLWHARIQDFARAKVCFAEAQAAQPRMLEYHANLALMHIVLGEPEKGNALLAQLPQPIKVTSESLHPTEVGVRMGGLS